MFEQQVTVSLDEILAMIYDKKIPLKGEFVIGISG